MKFYSIHGKLVNINLEKYRIDWDRKVSKPQFQVKHFLFPFWRNDIVVEELRIPSSLLRIDLCNLTKKIIIEVSPRALHVNYNKFLHGSRAGFLKKLKADAKKMVWAENNGFTFVELYDQEIDNLSVELFLEKFGIDL